ncbi:bromodomain-containing protein 4-like [Pempheris klunzingeri]|uniref:bromodomain-containing protein 4-like n=1 Tax=Pempheris klunzingeri TaxID=3127111 RepID=UPI00398076FF
MSGGIGLSTGLQSHSGDSTQDQDADSPKSTSGPEFLSLSRCAACFNLKANSMPRWGGDGESSSSAEDSGPEVDLESEAESSSSSSSCSGGPLSDREMQGAEKPPESGGQDGDGREETGETLESQDDKSKKNGVTRRAPLVKSFSLPTSFTPRLSPQSLLPRPHRVISTLNLQVLPHNYNDAFFIVQQQEMEESNSAGREGVNNLMPPLPFPSQQTGLPWQQRSHPILQQPLVQQSYQYQQQPHQLTHQHQQQQPQHFPPPPAQGQRLPPPLHTLPVFHPPTVHKSLQAPIPPHTHPHALTPQPCWYCSGMHFPYSPYWNCYSTGQLHR